MINGQRYKWIQARNMLLAGVCKSIMYAPGQQCRNSFEVRDGVIYRIWDYSLRATPGSPSNIDKFFIVKDW